MKGKKRLVIVSVAAVIIIIGIGSIVYSLSTKEPLSPKETVSTYYEEADQGNIDEAKEYISAAVIAQYENGGTWYANNLESAILQEGKEYTEIEPIKEEIEGNTATVDVAVTNTNGTEDETQYVLVKEDDHWKISFQ